MKNRIQQRRVRHQRIRQRIKGTASRPRMAIAKSNKNIFIQFIDDVAQNTLASYSTSKADKMNLEVATEAGKAAAEAAMAKGITEVVVDRGGFLVHGKVKAVVDAAVEAGLTISKKAVAKDAEENA